MDQTLLYPTLEGMLDLLEQLEHKAPQEIQEHKVIQEHKAPQEHKEIQEHEAPQEIQEYKELKDQ